MLPDGSGVVFLMARGGGCLLLHKALASCWPNVGQLFSFWYVTKSLYSSATALALLIQPSKLTSSRPVADGKHSSSKLLLLYFLHKLLAVSKKTLNASVLPVGHADLPAVRQERQAVGNHEGKPPPSIRRTFTWIRPEGEQHRNRKLFKFVDKKSYNHISVFKGIWVFSSLLKLLWKHCKHEENTAVLWLTVNY